MALRCLSRFNGSFLACLRLLRLAAKLNSIVWRQHCFRANQRIELPGADEPRGERLFLQARSIKMRGLGDRRRIVVADPWRKRGAKHQGLPHQFVDPLLFAASPSTQWHRKLSMASGRRARLSRNANAMTGL